MFFGTNRNQFHSKTFQTQRRHSTAAVSASFCLIDHEQRAFMSLAAAFPVALSLRLSGVFFYLLPGR
jgi:hypothetical protein